MIGSGLVPATAGLKFTCSHLDLGFRSLHKPENACQKDLNLAMSYLSIILAGQTRSFSIALPVLTFFQEVNEAGPIMPCDDYRGRVADSCRDSSDQVCP